MWIKYNANPVANRVEDCAIRAVAVALNISWDDAFDLIAISAKQMGGVMHLNAAFGAVLRKYGFRTFPTRKQVFPAEHNELLET